MLSAPNSPFTVRGGEVPKAFELEVPREDADDTRAPWEQVASPAPEQMAAEGLGLLLRLGKRLADTLDWESPVGYLGTVRRRRAARCRPVKRADV